MTVVLEAGTIPTSTPPEQELERTIALVEEAQSMGPEKTFPSAESVSVPCPGDIWMQSPVRLGFEPAEACSWFLPGSPAVPRSIVARLFDGPLESDDVTRRPLSLLSRRTLPRTLTFSPPNSWSPCLTFPQATRPLTVESGAAPAVSKISSPSKALPEVTTVPWPLAGDTGTPLTLRTAAPVT